MKRSIFIAAVLLLFVARDIGAVGFGDIMGLKDEAKEKIKEARATQTAQIQETEQEDGLTKLDRVATKTMGKSEEKQERFSEKKKLVIQKYFDKMVKRIEKALERLTNIAGRIATQLTKMEAKGMDVAQLRTRLGEANTLRDQARTKLETARTTIAAILASESLPKEKFSEVKVVVREVVDLVKQTHRAYREIVQDIAKIYNFGLGPKGTVTPTAIISITPTLTITLGVSVTPTP